MLLLSVRLFRLPWSMPLPRTRVLPSRVGRGRTFGGGSGRRRAGFPAIYLVPTAGLLSLGLLGLTAGRAAAVEPVVVPTLEDPAEIEGGFLFRVGDDPSWAAPGLDEGDWQELSVPEPWGLAGHPDADVAWYRLRIRLAPGALGPDERLAIGVGAVSSAYELYADGRRIGRMAGPPPDLAYDRHAVWPVPGASVRDGEVVLAFRVWRHPAEGPLAGGLRSAIRVGRHEDLLLRGLRREIPGLVLAVLLLTFGLYHLQLFRKRREQGSYLWLGLFLIATAAYVLIRSQLHFQLIPDFVRGKEIEHLIALTATPLGFVAVTSILSCRHSRWMWGYIVSHPLLGLAVFFDPGLELNLWVLGWWPIYTAPGVVYLFFLLGRRAWTGDPEARAITAGTVVMVLAFTWDQLAANNLVPLLFLTPVGVLAFSGSLALSLSQRFDRVHRQLDLLRADLEMRVEERTRELASAKVQAEAADRAKGEFLANVSHELRTPVHGIRRISTLLRRRSEDPEVLEGLSAMDRSIDQLMGLVDDILTFSQVETGELAFEVEEIEPREVVRSVADVLRRRAESKGLVFGLRVAAEVPDRLYTDPARLSQVLFHLGGNAVKFTEHGEVHLEVDPAHGETGRGDATPTPGSAPGTEVTSPAVEGIDSADTHDADASTSGVGTALAITVRDTGPGMDDATLARLFRPFTQGDSSSTRRHGGAGLGLVLSQRLVTRAGGRIELSSTAGEGSSFRVIWPCLGSAAREDTTPSSTAGPTASFPPTPPEPTPPDAPEAAENPRHRVLVVEDDDISRLVLTTELEERGLGVVAVENGQLALEELGRRSFDLVLMDCQMPVMDGYRATRTLRRREAGRRHTPVVAVTAHAMEGDREKCLASGMDDYLPKPYSEAELAEKLAAWLPPEASTDSK